MAKFKHKFNTGVKVTYGKIIKDFGPGSDFQPIPMKKHFQEVNHLTRSLLF